MTIRHASFEAQIRAADTENQAGIATVAGYGSVFGSRNTYGEVFVPGAYADTLASVSDDKPLPMIDMHRQAVGRWTAHEEDAVGLRLEGFISDTAAGRDVATLLRDGAVTGLSIGFFPEEVHLAEPGETVSFDTPHGRFTSTQDRWTYYITRARLVEVSVVYAPSDDEARVLAVRSAGVAADKLAVALPGLRTDAPWEDVAWSMCRLMGAPGAGLTDLAPAERELLHTRLAGAYERHGKTAPDFTPCPSYKDIAFQHDEPALHLDRSLGKRCADVIAGINAIDRPLSDEARARALEARDALNQLLDEEPAEDELDTAAIVAELQRALTSITTTSTSQED